MAVRLPSSIIVALMLFVVIGILCQLEIPMRTKIINYLSFVLDTDFGLEFAVRPYARLSQIVQNFDLSALVQGLPRITTGW